jgi:hypothetical protein
MPRSSAVVEYWNNNYELIGDSRLGYTELTINDCFACGDSLQIQRAHINPLFKEKNNNVSNLHLLCARCHIESSLYSELGYWNWLKWKRLNEFDLSICHILKRQKMTGFDLQQNIHETMSPNSNDLEEILTKTVEQLKPLYLHGELFQDLLVKLIDQSQSKEESHE